MKTKYNILEVANTHGGDISYLKKLISEFSHFDGVGMKFQPFYYDEIATPDYEWYNVYKELYFTKKEWNEIISLASKTKDIWIDVGNNYCIDIINQNSSSIKGIKFQASVLGNKILLNQLAELDLSDKITILNIASLELSEIEKYLHSITSSLNSKKTVLQIGFQNYPTKLIDSGISKINKLKSSFDNDISIADHLSPKDENSIWIPLIASMMGVSIIEKHIKHSTLKTKYDYHSSMNIKQYEKFYTLLNNYHELLEQPFINKNEEKYLSSTLMKPVASKFIPANSIINSNEDITYKRSNSKGISIDEIIDLNNSFQMLSVNKEPNETFIKKDFNKAKIAAIIACRLKSTRLEKKALLKIGSLNSIELCQKNVLNVNNLDNVILATSNLPEDSELKKYTFNDDVIFHVGHPDDVIERYLTAINKYKIDVVVRLTGDCPYPSNEIIQILLKSHFETAADYTAAKVSAIGSDPQIFSTKTLKKIRKMFPKTNYSEYMNAYVVNNPKYFKINIVELPPDLVRDYRLTLDYKEDLEFFRIIEKYFREKNLQFSFPKLFSFLDDNPSIVEINNKMHIKYIHDEKLVNKINLATTYNNDKPG